MQIIILLIVFEVVFAKQLGYIKVPTETELSHISLLDELKENVIQIDSLLKKMKETIDKMEDEGTKDNKRLQTFIKSEIEKGIVNVKHSIISEITKNFTITTKINNSNKGQKEELSGVIEENQIDFLLRNSIAFEETFDSKSDGSFEQRWKDYKEKPYLLNRINSTFNSGQSFLSKNSIDGLYSSFSMFSFVGKPLVLQSVFKSEKSSLMHIRLYGCDSSMKNFDLNRTWLNIGISKRKMFIGNDDYLIKYDGSTTTNLNYIDFPDFYIGNYPENGLHLFKLVINDGKCIKAYIDTRKEVDVCSEKKFLSDKPICGILLFVNTLFSDLEVDNVLLTSNEDYADKSVKGIILK